MGTPETLGGRIRQLRGNIPQSEYSVSIGINQNTLSRYERNERTPDTATIKRICQLSGCSLEWLISGRDARSSQPVFSCGEDETTRIQQLEARLDVLEEERRDLNAENRQLHRDKAELLRENGELRERVARLEERKRGYDRTHDLPAEDSGVA